MIEVEEKFLREIIANFDKLPENKQDWFAMVGRRLAWNEQDFRTYLKIIQSDKDVKFFGGLKLKPNMSYYVVAESREALEKFRIYYTVHGAKTFEDFIRFTQKIFLNTYVEQTSNPNCDINDMVLSGKRLLVYCHKNNKYVSDKQQAWIQGNLFCSDVCDRLIKGHKVLILAEYNIKELDDILGDIKLLKINISKTDLTNHGLYTLKNNVAKRATEKRDDDWEYRN